MTVFTHLDGIVFDCDGTLADTMPLHWLAWDATAKRHGIQFSEPRFYALGGVPARAILKQLCEEQNLALDPLAVASEKEAAYLTYLDQVKPIEAVVQIAREHHGKIPLGVASGGTQDIIDLVLRRLGIRNLFDAVVTSEDVVRQKPAPDIFLEAARRLGVQASRCRGYEDTELGMQAIRSAGMEAVHVDEVLQNASPPWNRGLEPR